MVVSGQHVGSSMTLNDFIDRVRGDLELFKHEVMRDEHPLDPLETPPLADGIPPGVLTDFEIWFEEFKAFLDEHPLDP